MATALLVVLGLSLVVNFAGVGFFLSAFGRPDGGQTLSISNALVLANRRFPAEIRSALHDTFAAEPEHMRAAFRALKDARRATYEAMKAEPFDRERLEAAFALERQRTMEVQEIGHAALAAAIAGATPEERARIDAHRGGGERLSDEERERRREQRDEKPPRSPAPPLDPAASSAPGAPPASDLPASDLPESGETPDPADATAR
jgi:hypothetical protein